MKKILTIAIVTLLLLTSSVTAMKVQFFYSKNCPHCQTMYPVVMNFVNKYPKITWGIYEVNSDVDNLKAYQEQGFSGVPAFSITTSDCREIQFVGADTKKFQCEVEEMTTKDCPTFSADKEPIEGSWFDLKR